MNNLLFNAPTEVGILRQGNKLSRCPQVNVHLAVRSNGYMEIIDNLLEAMEGTSDRRDGI
jgi:hypothetical protein